jgi:plastocyanin
VSRLAALTALWLGVLGGPASPADHRVTVSVFDYRPNTVTINPGDSVSWRWSGPDTNHSVSALQDVAERFDSDPDVPVDAINHEVGATFQHTFSNAGAFDYLCRVHPRFMRGTVTVLVVPDHVPPRIHSLSTRPGARLRFRLSERASLRGELRRIGAPGSPLPVRRLRFRGMRGRNEVQLPTRGLRPVRYRITLTATDAVGNVSKPARTSFTPRRVG